MKKKGDVDVATGTGTEVFQTTMKKSRSEGGEDKHTTMTTVVNLNRDHHDPTIEMCPGAEKGRRTNMRSGIGLIRGPNIVPHHGEDLQIPAPRGPPQNSLKGAQLAGAGIGGLLRVDRKHLRVRVGVGEVGGGAGGLVRGMRGVVRGMIWWV